MHDNNCFITLTYNDQNLPGDFSLVKKHFQDFMKRLRFKFGPGIRYFHCGEYGEENKRPHYHACLFNFDFQDKELFSTRQGVLLYTSPDLVSLWPFGFSTIGNVTFESAAYVARYITKKITGDQAADHYQGRLPEYTTMSLKPAIGHGWFEKFFEDIYPHDLAIINGKKMKPPKYYDKLYDITHPGQMLKIKANRKKATIERADNNTLRRLQDRETCKQKQLQQLIRPIERSN